MFAGPATADAIPRHRKVTARYRNVFTGVKAIRSSIYRVKKMEAMYRTETILARNISIEVTLPRSFLEIAAVDRHPSCVTTFGLNSSIDWQFIRDTLPPLFW